MKVTVDMDRCVGAMECAKCLNICPSTVFAMYPKEVKMFEPSEEWEIIPELDMLCVGCMKCVEICPGNAIEVQESEVEAK
ncbi:MAG: 4Fe-4S dicluster domain-containing protein [Candidatus Jordarchaeum sp.]|uniref:4Fe-4S dicluster domain-containing protein n=1 Tax=Candidatus Jordarchaeum sp. TaxID=2823881 RepID=UPI004049EEA1